MRINAARSSESGSAELRSVGERARARKPPGPAMPRLLPSADLVALQRIMQRRSAPAPTEGVPVQREAARGRKGNTTGLPDSLKAGVEALSGVALDDVKVRYNSERPAQMQAHAYTQGAEIHVAPGQERYLAHEAWHAAQQAQGRVRATAQLKGAGLNDEPALEREADSMGARAARGGGASTVTEVMPGSSASFFGPPGSNGAVQRSTIGPIQMQKYEVGVKVVAFVGDRVIKGIVIESNNKCCTIRTKSGDVHESVPHDYIGKYSEKNEYFFAPKVLQSPKSSGDRPEASKKLKEQGSGGQVFVADSQGRKVLLKEVSDKQKFLRETRNLRALAGKGNQYVASYLDSGWNSESGDGSGWISIEFVAGASLRAALDSELLGKLGSESTLPVALRHIFFGVLSGLASLNKQGIIHRDIKPGNIMLDAATGDARIIDLGDAKIVNPDDIKKNHPTNNSKGTYSLGRSPEDDKFLKTEIEKMNVGYKGGMGYWAPEAQTLKDKSSFVTATTDTYAVGMSMLEAMVKLGVKDKDMSSVAAKLINEDPSKRPTPTEALEESWFKNHDETKGREILKTLLGPERKQE